MHGGRVLLVLVGVVLAGCTGGIQKAVDHRSGFDVHPSGPAGPSVEVGDATQGNVSITVYGQPTRHLLAEPGGRVEDVEQAMIGPDVEITVRERQRSAVDDTTRTPSWTLHLDDLSPGAYKLSVHIETARCEGDCRVTSTTTIRRDLVVQGR